MNNHALIISILCSDKVDIRNNIEKFREKDVLQLFAKKPYIKQVIGYITTYTFQFDEDVTFYFNRGSLVKITEVCRNESLLMYLKKLKCNDKYA